LAGEVEVHDAIWLKGAAVHTIPPAEVGVRVPVVQSSFCISDALPELEQCVKIFVVVMNNRAMDVARLIAQ
jgi:hypothetical protein